MSQENVEAVRRAFAAFARGGPEAMPVFWDPEIELWVEPGQVQAGTYRGRADILDWMKEWAEAWEEIDYAPEDFSEAGDSVLVSVLYDGRGRGSGVRVQGRFWYLMKLRKGKVLRWRLYAEKTRALEAAGLSE